MMKMTPKGGSKPRLKMLPADWITLLPMLRASPIDFGAVNDHLEELFADSPDLLNTGRSAVKIIETSKLGQKPDLTGLKGLHIRAILGFLIYSGFMKATWEVLDAARNSSKANRFAVMETLLKSSGTDVEKMNFVDHPWEDWRVIDRGSANTILVFCGVTGRFGQPTNLIAVWLASLDCNIIYVRDKTGRLYLGGLKSFGDLEATVTEMKSTIEALGTKRLVCTGNSGGVMGALLYGDLLNADEVLCFAGRTSLVAGFDVIEDRPVYERIYQAIASGELTAPDFATAYRGNNVRVRYFYGADREFDSRQAENLRGIPNVSLEPIPDWDGHFVLGELARMEKLADIFKDAVLGTTNGE